LVLLQDIFLDNPQQYTAISCAIQAARPICGAGYVKGPQSKTFKGEGSRRSTNMATKKKAKKAATKKKK
jgi:hypothetical protein